MPLVIIDGIIGATLDQVDPNDIESIVLLKDGTATAIYGLRATSGAILIRTKRAEAQQVGWRFSYSGQAAASDFASEVPVLDPTSYLAAGGNDLGSSTNWAEQITRTGWSQAHGLAIRWACNWWPAIRSKIPRKNSVGPPSAI